MVVPPPPPGDTPKTAVLAEKQPRKPETGMIGCFLTRISVRTFRPRPV